ncbi:MAG: DUF3520 domain-containing protein [Verrucomicrobia bacterium]|jgi:Mg-chelatase subunit ChlD|nr:DUF3520 domain-containing protein [Verrucomicrobiota bacterium]
MKEPLTQNEDIEVLLTSYLLGELGDADIQRVELALREDPDLRVMAKELEASISVLRQAAFAGLDENKSEQQAPKKLSADRRVDLLALLRQEDTSNSIIKISTTRRIPWFVPMGIAACLILLLSAYSFMLQTRSPMMDAVGAAGRMVALSDLSLSNTAELFSNSMTPFGLEGESKVRAIELDFKEGESSDDYFEDYSASIPSRKMAHGAITQSQVDQPMALWDESGSALGVSGESERFRYESKNERLSGAFKDVELRFAAKEPAVSFGRQTRAAVQRNNSSSSSPDTSSDINENLIDQLGAIQMDQDKQSNLGLMSMPTSDGPKAKVESKSLPRVKSLEDSMKSGTRYGMAGSVEEAERDFEAKDGLDANEAVPRSVVREEPLLERGFRRQWGFQTPSDESRLLDGKQQESQVELRKAPAPRPNIETLEKGVGQSLVKRFASAQFGTESFGELSEAEGLSLGFREESSSATVANGVVNHFNFFAAPSEPTANFDDQAQTKPTPTASVDFDATVQNFSGGQAGEGKPGPIAGSRIFNKTENLARGGYRGGDLGGGAGMRVEATGGVDYGFKKMESGNEKRASKSNENLFAEYSDGRMASPEPSIEPITGLPDSDSFSASVNVIQIMDGAVPESDDLLAYGLQVNRELSDHGIVSDFSAHSSNSEWNRPLDVEPVEGFYRGRMLGEQQLLEQNETVTVEQIALGDTPVLGKAFTASIDAKSDDVMRRLETRSASKRLAELAPAREKVVREEPTMKYRIAQGLPELKQLEQQSLSQPTSSAQTTLLGTELSTVSDLGRESVLDALTIDLKRKSSDSKPASASNVDHRPEQEASVESTSTFSLNVSDVSFKLAKAALEQGQLPDPESIRSEQFLNAFDYRDPAPYSNQPIGFHSEQARHPFAHHRDVVRFALQTAASGRVSDRPMHLTILLDNSGSMQRSDRREILRQALNVLSQQLTSQDKISVVSFARTARLWVDGVAGGSPVLLLEKVNNLIPQGGTNIEEALNAAYEVASDHYVKNGINRVVLLTDGAANLGNVDPEVLKQKVVTERRRGIAFDCFGVGWDGLNDPLLEVLSRNGDGRYGFLNDSTDASSEFADQLAGALNVAASDVKVQVEFNPDRVRQWRQIGYARHQLTKEQFRDNTVDAAEIAAAESGNALYVIELNESGSGPVGHVRVRYRVPHTSQYREKEWTVPYRASVPASEDSSPAMKLALASGLFAEWLNGNPHAGSISIDALQKLYRSVPKTFGEDPRPYDLERMFEQVRSITGL